MTTSPRVVTFPIGHPYSDEKEIVFLNQLALGHTADVNICFMCFLRSIPRTPNPRDGIYEMFQGHGWVTTNGGFDHIAPDIFYQDMRHHTYTISPPGAGLDCHRHWEAMALGSIPIVLRSRATDILEDMPCLRVDHWGEVALELLLTEKDKLQDRFNHGSMEKMDMDFWRKRIIL